MKAKWTSIVDDLQGSVDSRHYARHIPGNGVEQEDQEKESKPAACEGVWRADCDMQGDST